MAERSLPKAEAVKLNISLDDWSKCGSKDFNFLPDDVNKSKELASKTDNSNAYTDDEKKLLQSLKDLNNISKVGIVTKLVNNRYLAWGTTPPDVVHFYLLDPTSADPVLLGFQYNVTSFIQTYSDAFMGSCGPGPKNTVDFGFWTNQSMDLVVVMGPAEEEKFTESGDYARRNGCKLVNSKTATVEDFSLTLPSPHDKEGPAYPAAFAPDPRPEHQDDVVMIASNRCASLEFNGTGDVLGYPLRYSLADSSVKTVNTDKLLFGKLVHYIGGGQHVACLEHPEYDEKQKQKSQKIWILDTDTLKPLYTILHSGIENRMVLLTSTDNKYIAQVSAGYRLGNWEKQVSIFKCPESNAALVKDGPGLIPMNTMTMFQVEISKEY